MTGYRVRSIAEELKDIGKTFAVRWHYFGMDGNPAQPLGQPIVRWTHYGRWTPDGRAVLNNRGGAIYP